MSGFSGIRFTYDANVTVPKELLALMSASNPQSKNETGVYHFEMKQAIPSYLLALAVGDVAFKPVSERSGVYAEPSVLDAQFGNLLILKRWSRERRNCMGLTSGSDMT
jgi:aminopeptidase N